MQANKQPIYTDMPMYFISHQNMLNVSILLMMLAGCSRGLVPEDKAEHEAVQPLDISQLVSQAYAAARQHGETMPGPRYMEELLADGRLTIGLGIGTSDLGEVAVPDQAEGRLAEAHYFLQGKWVLVSSRLILSKAEFQKALTECEILFVTSHSRFGAGPVFLQDGKAEPFRMQGTSDYKIVMPQKEVSGYQGSVRQTYTKPTLKKTYVVFEPDSSDLDQSTPLQGYQLIVLSTCTSLRHFLDDIARFRKGLPTTAIFTTRPCCMDTRMRPFTRLLYGIFRAQPIAQVVAGLNEEYCAVAWENVKKGIPPWQVINNLYALGIDTLAE
jgi:hypothetical protein